MKAPIFVDELELTNPIVDLVLPERADGAPWQGVHALVRLAHVPVGYVFLEPGALDAAGVERQVWEQLAGPIKAQCAKAGLPALDALPADGIVAESAFAGDDQDRPLISVIVCTRDRPESLMETLRSLAAMHYRPFEVVVIDNAPKTEATKEAVAAAFGDDERFRYVREPRPGLSCARNRGLAEALGDIIAFTDDDVVVDPWWLDGTLRGFRSAPDVACVTGLVATAKLENNMQLYFHLREAWGVACERRTFDLENRDDSPLYPYSPGIFGAGASLAITRGLVKEIGEFNEALGAGTVTGGGEDLEYFMRTILSGNRLVYEPSAIVYHYHRDDLAELSDQMLRYGMGCTAALTAIVMRLPRARRELPLRAVRGALRLFTLNERVKDNESLPPGMMKKEIRGLAIGPWRYFKSRRKLQARAA